MTLFLRILHSTDTERSIHEVIAEPNQQSDARGKDSITIIYNTHAI